MSSDPNEKGNSRRWIVREVENSLRRLDTDYIDLYQVHRPEPGTDIDDTLSALSDLVHQGKVNYLGSSTFPAEAIVEAQWTAERRGHERFRVEQPPYSIFVRGIEESVLPTCEQYGMGVIPWSPLNGGFLTGRYRPGEAAPTTGRAARTPDRFDPERPAVQRKLALVPELEKVAADAGMPLTHLAIGFTLAHPAVSAAIIGPRTMEQLEGLLDVGRRARRRDPRPHRRARRAGHERQPGRSRLGPPRAQPGLAAAASGRCPMSGEHRPAQDRSGRVPAWTRPGWNGSPGTCRRSTSSAGASRAVRSRSRATGASATSVRSA